MTAVPSRSRRHGSIVGEDLTAKTLDALAALAAIDEESGVSYTRWRNQAADHGVADSSLDRARKVLVDRGLVTPIGAPSGRSKLYALTDAGRAQLPPSAQNGGSAP